MGLRQVGAARVLIRGIGDIGSAVAWRLFISGHAVVLHDGEQPTTTRRGMAFADAIFDGHATLDGVAAVRVDHAEAVPALRAVVPVVVGDFSVLLRLVAPDVLVDNASDVAFRAALRERVLPRGSTVVTVAHRLITALDADRVIVLDKGRIVEEGAPAALIASRVASRRRWSSKPWGGTWRSSV